MSSVSPEKNPVVIWSRPSMCPYMDRLHIHETICVSPLYPTSIKPADASGMQLKDDSIIANQSLPCCYLWSQLYAKDYKTLYVLDYHHYKMIKLWQRKFWVIITCFWNWLSDRKSNSWLKLPLQVYFFYYKIIPLLIINMKFLVKIKNPLLFFLKHILCTVAY